MFNQYLTDTYQLQNLSSEISDAISIRKEYYVNFSNKLNHPSTR